jgi:hypothetical protein
LMFTVNPALVAGQHCGRSKKATEY